MKVSCIILAGGKSKRLRNKPFLLLDKKPLISYVLKVARKFFRDIIIVVKNKSQRKRMEKIAPKRVKIVEDNTRTTSPIAGIKEGIKHAKNDYVFILGCDMPLLREKTIRELLPRTEEDVDCIAYIWKLRRYEPLCAIYKKKVFENRKLKTGLHQLIDSIENKVFVPIALETNEFFNVNTKRDLKKAKELLGSKLR